MSEYGKLLLFLTLYSQSLIAIGKIVVEKLHVHSFLQPQKVKTVEFMCAWGAGLLLFPLFKWVMWGNFETEALQWMTSFLNR